MLSFVNKRTPIAAIICYFKATVGREEEVVVLYTVTFHRVAAEFELEGYSFIHFERSQCRSNY